MSVTEAEVNQHSKTVSANVNMKSLMKIVTLTLDELIFRLIHIFLCRTFDSLHSEFIYCSAFSRDLLGGA